MCATINLQIGQTKGWLYLPCVLKVAATSLVTWPICQVICLGAYSCSCAAMLNMKLHSFGKNIFSGKPKHSALGSCTRELQLVCPSGGASNLFHITMTRKVTCRGGHLYHIWYVMHAFQLGRWWGSRVSRAKERLYYDYCHYLIILMRHHAWHLPCEAFHPLNYNWTGRV